MTKIEVKKEALRILEELGLCEETAIDIFYRQVVLNKGLPFPVKLPVAKSVADREEDVAFGTSVADRDEDKVSCASVADREEDVAFGTSVADRDEKVVLGVSMAVKDEDKVFGTSVADRDEEVVFGTPVADKKEDVNLSAPVYDENAIKEYIESQIAAKVEEERQKAKKEREERLEKQAQELERERVPYYDDEEFYEDNVFMEFKTVTNEKKKDTRSLDEIYDSLTS